MRNHSSPCRLLPAALAALMAVGVLSAPTAAHADDSLVTTEQTDLLSMPLRPVVLDQGHLDLFELTYDQEAERLDLRVKDDTELYDLDAVYREPETVTVAVDQEKAAFSLEEVPPGYEFLGPPGRETYMLDWSQQEGLPWPGWSTERLVGTLPAGVEIPYQQGAVAFGVEVEGPGDVFAFIPGDSGPENKYIDTTDDQPDIIETGPGIHYHTTWVFSEPGDYELRVTPSATTTTGDTLSGPAKSYHFHVGPRPDLPARVSAEALGASITGVPATVGAGTEVTLELQLAEPLPQIASYQWYRWIDGQQDVKLAGATSPQVTTTVDPWDMVYVALLDESGRILSVAYAFFLPEPSPPNAPHNPYAWVEPNGKDVTLSWGTPGNGNSPLTGYVATLTSSTGTVLTEAVDGGDACEVTFTDVPAGTWAGTVHAINAIGAGPESEPSPPVTVTAPEPDPEPSSPDTEPVSEADLTETTTGDVEVLGDGAPFAPGAELTVRVGAAHAGEWMSPWLHSTPVWLGWKQVESTGAIKVRLPADAADGQHRIVVKTAAGDLLGWDELTVAKASIADPSPDPGSGLVATTVTAAAATQTYGKTSQLAVTVSPGATGQVSVKVGSATVSGTLSNGEATLTLPKKVLEPGKRVVTIAYAGESGKFHPAIGHAVVMVAKAKPAVTVKAVKTKAKPGEIAAFRVSVSAPGVRPGGKVTLAIGAKTKTVRLSSRGKATVEIMLSRWAKPGRKKVSVSYGGDKHVAKGKAHTKIRVVP